MTISLISLGISVIAVFISLWGRFEDFTKTRRSRTLDRIRRIGECIDLATKMNFKAEDFERLFEKVKPISSDPNSDAMKLTNWENTMSNIKNAKNAMQAFIENGHQYLEDFKKRKRVKLSQIEIEAFLAQFKCINTNQEHLFTSFENLIIEKKVQQVKYEELKSEKQILLKEKSELEAERQMILNKKNQIEVELKKPKKV